jgi:Ca-activated chloride channel family protein
MPRLSTLALFLLLPAVGRTQEAEPPPPSPTTTLSVQVRVVAIDAVVRDASGNPVQHLTPDAFRLREDGKPVAFRYFSQDDNLPLTVGLMVDTSGSQREFFSDEALAADIFLRNALTHPEDRAFIAIFDSSVQLLQPMTPHLSELHKGLRLLDYHTDPMFSVNGGGTLLFDAIVKASSDLIVQPTPNHEPGRRALVVLTDGDDNGSRATREEAIRQAQLNDVAVYSVLYTNEDPHYPKVSALRPSGIAVMRDISHATGGRDFLVGKGTSIADIFSAIAEDLRNQYRIGITPTPSKPGKYHSLDLKPTDKSLTVQARTGYYAPK